MRDSPYGRFVDRLAALGRRRVLRVVRPAGPGTVIRDGRELVNFSSNDYLGLSQHPELVRRVQDCSSRYGAGAGASRLVTGTLDLHESIEAKIAAGKGTESALLLASGYQANVSLLAALLDAKVLGAEPLVFADRLNHASLHDGCRMASAHQIRYRHRDLNHLEDLLERHKGESRPRFILSETVFSMDGDEADVGALAALARRYDAFLYLDESHSTGLFGPNGFGHAASFPGDVDLAMGTFGKALGSYGAYAACSSRLREFLINRCAGLVYSTALPPPLLGAIDAALDLLPGMEQERRALQERARSMRVSFAASGLDCGQSTTQIVPVIVSGDAAAMALAGDLEEEGLLAVAIRPPTVPEGTSRLRFSLTAAHRDEHIAQLIEAVPRLAAGAMTPRTGTAS